MSVSNDLTPEAARKKADLRAVLNLAKLKGINAGWKGQAIVVNEKRYTHSNLNELPNELSIENAKTLKIDHGIVFQDEHSFLSNFHRAPPLTYRVAAFRMWNKRICMCITLQYTSHCRRNSQNAWSVYMQTPRQTDQNDRWMGQDQNLCSRVLRFVLLVALGTGNDHTK